VILAAGFGVLAAGGAGLVADLHGLVVSALAGAAGSSGVAGDARALAGAAEAGFRTLARTLALPLGMLLAAAIGIGLLQTRGLLVAGPLVPDLGRLSPAAGLRRVFGAEALGEIGKALLRVLVVAAVAWITLRALTPDIIALAGATPARAWGALGAAGQRLGLRVALAALLLGLGDYLIERARHARSLRMTRDEVKREHRESEGDPRHKAERQRLHRDLAEQRMVADVRKADFVVVNPDHIAVALRYQPEGPAEAPVVVAKGERLLAERIKTVAREAGIPIFHDVALARSLRDVEEGDEIPEPLYQAVAEILRVVQRASAPDRDIGPAPDAAEPAPPQAPASLWKRA